MSELAATIREALATFAASDRTLRRFGAASHRYELLPPLTAGELDAIDAALARAGTGALPDDVRELATTLGAGGAGPYYGWLPVADAAARTFDAPAGVTAWQRALPIAHVGCGYAAVLPLDGAARGEVWIDARTLAIAAPIATSFTALYLDWIDRLARNVPPEAFVPRGACALANALGGYLGMAERRLGLAPGTIAGEALRDALERLGAGAIELAAEDTAPLFAPGQRVDPCIACATLVENLAADGLRRDVVAPGSRPLSGG